MLRTMTYPEINLNGSEGADLAEQYLAAYFAVETAKTAMAGIVHGRDYQTLPASAYTAAVEEMRHRITTLHDIATDMHLLAAHCMGMEGGK